MTQTSSAGRFARPEVIQRPEIWESASSSRKLALNTEKRARGGIPDHHNAVEFFIDR